MQQRNYSAHAELSDGQGSYMDSDFNPRKKHEYRQDDFFKNFSGAEQDHQSVEQVARSLSPTP